MKRKLLIMLFGILGLLAVVIIGALALFLIYINPYIPEKDTPHHVADFIRKNPKRSSIYFARNGEVLSDVNSDTLFPLASTVKIIIAIEYAKRVGKGEIDPQEQIELAELDKYYLGVDGGAHPKWLEEFGKKRLIKDDKASINDVAKGMIWYSSNANTEYLLDRLGIDNINQNLSELGLSKHEKLFHVTASALLRKIMTEAEIKALTKEQYAAKSLEIHEKLKAGTMGKSPPSYISGLISLITNGDKNWSDNLPASTTKEYASIMKKINSRSYFDEKTQTALEDVLEAHMQLPEYREKFEHIGGKGGSTSFVLTKALFATAKDGSKLELCIFFNNLNLFEAMELRDKMREFEKLMLTDENFRAEILAGLNTR